jgi:hypothetical protein
MMTVRTCQFTYTPTKTPSQCHNRVLEPFFTHPQGISLHHIPYTNLHFICTYHPNTNLTQYEVWNFLGGQCKGYSLLASDTVQFSVLSPAYWSVQHSKDCGNMYLSNVGTQNTIKNATVYPKVSYEGVRVAKPPTRTF